MKKIFIALLLSYSSTSFAVCVSGTCGPATRYDVNVQEVALCQEATCTSPAPYIVGSGVRTFDIASAAVGAAVGSYANFDAVPPATYTHVRLLFSRTFVMTGAAVAPCAAQTAASLSIPNGVPIDPFAGGAIPGMSWNDAAKTQVKWIKQLTAPMVIAQGGQPPTIAIKFGTQGSLMCAADGNPYPAPPDLSF
jgi:hypothetical protein